MLLEFLLLSLSAAFEYSLLNLQQIFYTTPLRVNNQTVNVVVDTGSSNFWLDESRFHCAPPQCQYSSDGKNVDLEYGIGSIRGKTATVLVQEAGVAYNVSVLLVYQHSNLDISADGLLGLSKPEGNEITFVEQLSNHKLIQKPAFSLQLNDKTCAQDSKLILGAYDPRYFNGSLSYFQSKQKIFWELPFSSINFLGAPNNQILMKTQVSSFIIDSGTTKLVVPEFEFEQILRILNDDFKMNCDDMSDGQVREMECDFKHFPKMEIKLQNFTIELLPQDYVNSCEFNQFLQRKCLLNFQRILTTDTTSESFVLGVPFMQKYYTYFDYETNQVGLAPSLTYTKSSRSLEELGHKYNYQTLYICLCGTALILAAFYLIVKLLIGRSTPLYQAVLEKSSSRSQEQDHEMVTLKTQHTPTLTA